MHADNDNAPTAAPGQPPAVSVVTPCYNEQESLGEFHRRVKAVLESLGQSHEIILVDDGSTDQTWQRMTDLAGEDPALVLVKLSRNHGQQLALTAGLNVCRGHRVLILDADLQDPPELLPKMMAVMDGGADVVYGRRNRRAGESVFKRGTASLFYRLINRLSDTPIPLDTGDFRLISRRALDVLRSMPERHRFVRGMVSWIGFHQEPFGYDRDPRFAGTSKYPLRTLIRLALDAITSFSVKPLRMATVLGLLAAMFGLGVLVYVFISWLAGSTVHGWTSTLAAVAILGSIQLLTLGVLGMYVGRMYEQTKGRPIFIIETIRRGAGDKADTGT